MLGWWLVGDLTADAAFAIERDGLTLQVARELPSGQTDEVLTLA